MSIKNMKETSPISTSRFSVTDVEIHEITVGSSEYQAELELRYRVLREPLGLPLSEKDTGNDANEIHLGAFCQTPDGLQLIGCLLLRRNSKDQVQMRQVSVAPSAHGYGIGRRLVQAFEARARILGANEIVMDARQTAHEFYTKLGYETTSELYIQSTIPHFKMRKALAPE